MRSVVVMGAANAPATHALMGENTPLSVTPEHHDSGTYCDTITALPNINICRPQLAWLPVLRAAARRRPSLKL